MTEIWIDAQLSPALAAWINNNYNNINARSVRALNLREAEDEAIFQRAREANVVVMSKDSDFLNLLDSLGPPPKIIWVTCGNTSNQRMRSILKKTLQLAVDDWYNSYFCHAYLLLSALQNRICTRDC